MNLHVMIKQPLYLTKFAPFLTKSKHTLFKFHCKMASFRATGAPTVENVPGLSNEEMEKVCEESFVRYSSGGLSKKRGKGVVIVWFRNDLRVLDNEALFRAWVSSEVILPVYCVDPRLFGTTHYFGLPKTGALRAQFIIECLTDLKRNLVKRGLDLLIQHGKPEEIIPSLVKEYKAHTVYAHKETCSEEVKVEKLVTRNLQELVLPSSGEPGNVPRSRTTKLELVWGSTMYHIDDLPFDCESLPDVYTQFRKSVESKSKIRNCRRLPASLGPPPEVGDWGHVPQVTELGLQQEKASKGMKFIGGESAALGRVHDYFWKKDLLKVYKETRNGMLGPDYSTKFSPWLASGSLSPRFIYEEVKRYEKERLSNESTYWVLFELIWRDYFRFLSIKQGNLLFQAGPRKVNINWSQDQTMFDAWRQGQTGYPLIDANMKELAATGFMSNRGRQIVCSFLVRDMGIDWRMGAEWFEACLLDYDPCSNYGNWTYGAGVGNDPREDRYFSIPKQAQNYDPAGEFVAYWLPELRALPREKRHAPGMMYLKPIVALKHGYTKKTGDPKNAFSARRGRPEENRRKRYIDGRTY
ncbi:cryptochrome DASH, chloroplastic/mitochondrial isoform X2 [Capsicum annuum]|uniref:cryptochrome DASH, chloroplastic/mitochondrial isoform X2 n=1 Tax=Capsicum annuum TaxID=4072 RepID=UPI001FB0FC2F|nr:cryptochrome DASH, chloroplastic/mitochondrial isoform X2 [Capsicum annuum]